MKRKLTHILVTGGAGFIGSNFIHYLLHTEDFGGRIINLDTLTYAGNLENLKEIDSRFRDSRYFFIKGDICDADTVQDILSSFTIDTIFHFAAESHVDRSIDTSGAFIRTNVKGTFTLLEEARKYWKTRRDVLFHHVSTDEVFGSLGKTGFFYEHTPYGPRSPYSASKAASDHLVRAYYHTYGIPFTMSHCSNNYGPYQFPEKLIPLMIEKILEQSPLPVYGDGKHVRDWLYVKDHNRAIWLIAKKGQTGTSYNIGGENEWENIHLVKELCKIMADENNTDPSLYENLITFVHDRPGHDRRYAINCDRIKNELGWEQRVSFIQGLKKTVTWYLRNREWVNHIKSGAYLHWLEKNYAHRSKV
jgi:dTDP-glucose 4,6-dehydratase